MKDEGTAREISVTHARRKVPAGTGFPNLGKQPRLQDFNRYSIW